MEFKEKFNSFYPTLQEISKRYAAGTDIPYEEYESSLSEEFYLKYNMFDSEKRDNFGAYMRVVLTQRASRVANRTERKYYDSMMFYEAGMVGDDGETQEIDFPYIKNRDIPLSVSHEDIQFSWAVEEQVINDMENKTDADKRELIDALITNSDSLTKNIISEYLKSEDANPTGIGKKLGIHHQTVIRKLKRLAREFNEREFGEIDAYLAV